ncbi:Uncharacterized protein PECH_006293 [Penicillium ucsense]|uniref:Uncharacterized protein n=2 Tax=Penicillium TaxID=5073 RepID=A0A8J8WJE2_9EURO|nr:uncharacterized protein N7539_005618 [Penicillium diatomitis]KAF7718950.1 Uncharacterized protein PECM_000337 [Penicillium ucsense]KAF7739091.1 Uncharacterized protein PECH_006293 [Penicillium ucsense]KAJ5485630.1 hypothetical protein N7539_005618 [Penicillium diatomitis]
MYVNVHFEPADAHLCDHRLLKSLLWLIENDEATLTDCREDDYTENCLSIKVRASSEEEAYHKAEKRVKSWIRRYDDEGLPFERTDVFQVGLGLYYEARC